MMERHRVSPYSLWCRAVTHRGPRGGQPHTDQDRAGWPQPGAANRDGSCSRGSPAGARWQQSLPTSWKCRHIHHPPRLNGPRDRRQSARGTQSRVVLPPRHGDRPSRGHNNPGHGRPGGCRHSARCTRGEPTVTQTQHRGWLLNRVIGWIHHTDPMTLRSPRQQPPSPPPRTQGYTHQSMTTVQSMIITQQQPSARGTVIVAAGQWSTTMSKTSIDALPVSDHTVIVAIHHRDTTLHHINRHTQLASAADS